MAKEKAKKYSCRNCGYMYNPVWGGFDTYIEPGTAFEDIPHDWTCPICNSSKDCFSPVLSFF